MALQCQRWSVPISRSNLLRLRLKRGSTEAYVFGALSVALATLVRWGIGYFAEDSFVFAGYYPAVLFATYVGGAGVGGLAALLSTAIGWWAFIPPHFAFTPLTPEVVSKLLAFLFASALIVWGADRYRGLLDRLEDEEELRKLAVGELAHRLKNKIATIQSVISVRLRDDPQTRNAVLSLLNSLSATDDLIMATQGQGANFRDILSAEVGPYDISRISMQGPDVLLPPKLAMTLALVIHELATNAAKYGALTCPLGKVAICWSVSDRNKMIIDWRESDGPTIGPLTHRGFGTRLLSRALTQFGGTIESQFQPTGLICAISFTVPKEPEPQTTAASGASETFAGGAPPVLPVAK
jgi:two-component sensor histidine kinase